MIKHGQKQKIVIVRNNTEPNFDRACECAYKQAVGVLGIDDDGHSVEVKGWDRFRDSVKVEFVSSRDSVKVEFVSYRCSGGMGGQTHYYEFAAWANRGAGVVPNILRDDSMPAAAPHLLWTDADSDRPASICDGNGQVVLGLCKRCGKGESELSWPCVPPTPAAAPLDLAAMKRRAEAAKWLDEKSRSSPTEATVCGNLAADVLALVAECERLQMSLDGRDKAIDLLNKGFESACDDRDRLKQQVRQ